MNLLKVYYSPSKDHKSHKELLDILDYKIERLNEIKQMLKVADKKALRKS